MKNIRIWALLGTYAVLFLGSAGCHSKQTVNSSPTTPPVETVISKADLDKLRTEYVDKLHPNRAPEVRDGQDKVVDLIDFRGGIDSAHKSFDEFKRTVKHLAESNNAVVSDWHEGAQMFRFQYVRGRVHGSADAYMKTHYTTETAPPMWEILLKVKETL